MAFKKTGYVIETIEYAAELHGYVVYDGMGAGKGFHVASSAGGKTLPMTVQKILPKGSKINDVVNEVKGMTWMTGNEHAVVRLADGQKAIVSRGPGGISFQTNQIRTLFGIHTLHLLLLAFLIIVH